MVKSIPKENENVCPNIKDDTKTLKPGISLFHINLPLHLNDASNKRKCCQVDFKNYSLADKLRSSIQGLSYNPALSSTPIGNCKTLYVHQSTFWTYWLVFGCCPNLIRQELLHALWTRTLIKMSGFTK